MQTYFCARLYLTGQPTSMALLVSISMSRLLAANSFLTSRSPYSVLTTTHSPASSLRWDSSSHWLYQFWRANDDWSSFNAHRKSLVFDLGKQQRLIGMKPNLQSGTYSRLFLIPKLCTYSTIVGVARIDFLESLDHANFYPVWLLTPFTHRKKHLVLWIMQSSKSVHSLGKRALYLWRQGLLAKLPTVNVLMYSWNLHRGNY